MLFLSVRGFSDYAGPTVHSRFTWLPCCLPPTRNESRHPDLRAFRSSIAPPTDASGLRFKKHLAMSPRKTRGQDGFATSFPVGLLHPLQHAGLARRTPACPSSARNGGQIPTELPSSTRGPLAASVRSSVKPKPSLLMTLRPLSTVLPLHRSWFSAGALRRTERSSISSLTRPSALEFGKELLSPKTAPTVHFVSSSSDNIRVSLEFGYSRHALFRSELLLLGHELK